MQQWWQQWGQQRPEADLNHLDTAAAGRSSSATLAATAEHAQREASLGGYVAEGQARPVLAGLRTHLGELVGLPASAVGFVESATAALRTVLACWPCHPGDAVGVLASEWGPTLTMLAARGLELVELPADPAGCLDLEDFQRILATGRLAAVHLTQVASHRPLVQPVRDAAALCQAAGVALFVDAAQALGHVNAASGADVVYATSRKWLTGPRGVGMLAIAEQHWPALRIPVSELARELLGSDASPLLLLESHEAHVAGRVGLASAVEQFLADRPQRVWDRLAEVGEQTRAVLAELPGWQVVAPAGAPSAITALRATDGQQVATVRTRLLSEHRILTTVAAAARAPRELTAPLLRISPHVDVTPTRLETLRAALAGMS